MKVLITGASGQLGKRIKDTAPSWIELLTPSKSNLNLENLISCKDYIYKNKPDWIINCAAYTDVDKAEKERNKACKINGLAPKAFVEAINKTNGNILQISTDYVFSGQQGSPYKAEDDKNPINTYGFSKAMGEENIKNNINNINKATILRSSWVIGPYGKNFVITMLKLHKEKETIQVVCDQISSPTSTKELSKICWTILKSKEDNNLPLIIHWSNAGVASWYDLAISIGNIGLELGLLKKKAKVVPIRSSDYQRQAKRPSYSLLNTFEAQKLLKLEPSHWQDELKEIIYEIIDNKKIYI